ATVLSSTGLAAGNAVNSTLVPPGTTLSVVAGTSVTLALPTVTLPGRVNIAGPYIRDLPVAYNLASLVGSTVTGPGIPASTTVSSVTTTTDTKTGNITGIATLNNTPTLTTALKSPQTFFAFALTGTAVG